MMQQRNINKKKIEEVEKLKKLIAEYKVVGLVSLEKIGAKAVQDIRKALRGKVVMRMTKRRLMLRALKESGKPNIEELGKEIHGVSAMIFTDMSPTVLSRYLEEKSTKAQAKPGDITPIDIVVKAGNTRIPPGPIISELNQALKLPTLIKDGSIHVREDTTTHHKGDVINLKQSILLGRLGIEPMTVKLDFYAAYQNGEIVPEAVLKLDEKKFLKEFQTAYATAFALTMGLGILSKETVIPMLQKASRSANAVAIKTEFVTPDTLPLFVAKAASAARAIDTMVFGVEEVVVKAADKKDDKKKKNDKDDDEVMGDGIGALFGF